MWGVKGLRERGRICTSAGALTITRNLLVDLDGFESKMALLGTTFLVR
jgi:hypothetical protein